MLKTTSRKWRQNNILVSVVKNGLEINCSQLSLCTENRFFYFFVPSDMNRKMPLMYGLEWDIYSSFIMELLSRTSLMKLDAFTAKMSPLFIIFQVLICDS